MTTQIALRLEDRLVDELDVLVVHYDDLHSRSEAIRLAISEFVGRRRRALIDETIVAGYRRLPQVDDDAWGSLDAAVAESAGRAFAALDAEDGGWE